MSRELTVGVAQLGPIARSESRAEVVERLFALLHKAHDQRVELLVYPELALTTFFPRWWFEDEAELDSFYETEDPGSAGTSTEKLFATAAEFGIGIHLGYAELTADRHRYNTAMLTERDGSLVGKFRKVHIPGHEDHEPHRRFQHLERRYFEESQEGFQVWRAFGGIVGMAICNDRRWPETYRVMGLNGAELVLIGYNTPLHYPPDPTQDPLQAFHNHLVMQSGAYQNGMWVVGAAKGGTEEGCELLAHSCIIAPSGQIVAQAVTNGDELIRACIDLDMCANYKETLFDFARYRRPEAYRQIIERKGPIPPPE